ncbi:Uncharacterized protein Fot_05914 [Forsythia ovata]|uniref:Tektin n=1 Tax=Forsythia ovata TaxID=205694 RepID=A0ABD1WS25_9LAMI
MRDCTERIDLTATIHRNRRASENKDLREQLTFSEDARGRAIYDITKAKTIQRACVQAQKKAELQLRSCQNMVHANDKELTEALDELSRAQELLAKLGIPRLWRSQGSDRDLKADPKLEAIEQRRMQELIAQRGMVNDCLLNLKSVHTFDTVVATD